MHLTTHKVAVQNLQIGMYVSRLDVPWVQTPFPIQGFYITKQEELDLLSHYCNNIYVDAFLSKVDVKSNLSLTSTKKKPTDNIDPRIERLMNEAARFKPRVENYQITNKLSKEIKVAGKIYQNISSQMESIYDNMKRDGHFDFNQVRATSNDMVKSIIKNPNAFAWLCRVESEDGALHQQSVRSAVWAIIFARHLGLSTLDLRDIGAALLLAPIGKCKLPKAILISQTNDEEVNQYQQHINLTLKETEKMFSAKHQINYILASYCERNNGTGYPRGLAGNRISFLARVAGIADYYEQLINPYSGSNALNPDEAISHLYSVRGNLFQRELIESFIQAIGIYPTGSQVKLCNNTIGVVIEQPEKSRLRPKVAIFKDSADQLLEKPQIIDLAKTQVDDEGTPLKIDRSLRSASNDIDANELHQKLFANKSWFSFISA